MKILLIRHGETVDNVAGNLAGITDSALTIHGVLQTRRLGRHLAAKHGQFASIFCSDLQRARQTAQAILEACKQSASSIPSAPNDGPEALTILEILREQDFGSLEGKPWSSSNRETGKGPKLSDYMAPETKTSMDKRCHRFIDGFIIPLLIVQADCNVAVVSHGLLLSRLWKCILARSSAHEVQLASEVAVGPGGLEYTGAWSNTGCMDLDISVSSRQTESAKKDQPVLTDEKDRKAPPPDGSGHLPNAIKMKEHATANNDAQDGIEIGSAGNLARIPAKKSTDEAPLSLRLVVNAINSTAHLSSLKRTRGGIGSAAHDSSQKTLDGFFKRLRRG